MRRRKKLSTLLLASVILLGFSSCVNTKKATYFNNIRESSIASAPRVTAIIHKNDLLGISVTSLNAEASTMFNPISVSSADQQAGYLVNESGNIQFPVLGRIRAVGFTLEQLGDSITKALNQQKLLVSPIVTIRFLNFRVTILGEVKNPTVLNVPSQRISILEAIGLAGDLTNFGKRENILIIHDEPGKKTFARVDLTNKKIFSSPEYYLRSNDVVYVEQNKNKLRSLSNGRQLLPLVLSIISILVLSFSLLYRH